MTRSGSRKIKVFIAASLDGYIATCDGNLDFLRAVEKEDEDYGYAEFLKSVDTVILGRKTFDIVKALAGPELYQGRSIIVFSRTERPVEGNVEFYSGRVTDLVSRLHGQPGQDIFIDGGSEIINLFLKEELIDEFIISVIPVFLGDGIPLFRKGRSEMKLQLIGTRQYASGLVQLHYSR